MNEYAVCWSFPNTANLGETNEWKGPESEPRPEPDVTLEEGLNFMAEQGWELLFLTQGGPARVYTLTFRRDRGDQV